MSFQNGPESSHQCKLQNFCRLCGGFKAARMLSTDKLRFQNDLRRYLSLDVCADAPSIHPGKFCKVCLLYLKRLKNHYKRTRSLKEPRKIPDFQPHSSPCRVCDFVPCASPSKISPPPAVPTPGPLPSLAQPDDKFKAKRMRQSSADEFKGDKSQAASDSGPGYPPKPPPTTTASSYIKTAPSTSRGEPSSTSQAVSNGSPSYFPVWTPPHPTCRGEPSSARQAVPQAGPSESVPSTSHGEPSSTCTSQAVLNRGPSHFPVLISALLTCRGEHSGTRQAVSHAGPSESAPSTSHGEPSSASKTASHTGFTHFPQSTLSTSCVEPSNKSQAASRAPFSNFPLATMSNSHLELASARNGVTHASPSKSVPSASCSKPSGVSHISQSTPANSSGDPSSASNGVTLTDAGSTQFSRPTPSTSRGKPSSASSAASHAGSTHFPVPTSSNSSGKLPSASNGVTNAGPLHSRKPTPSISPGKAASASKAAEESEIVTSLPNIKWNSIPLYRFVNKTQANVFLCMMCTNRMGAPYVACHPRLASCGHMFCCDCILAWLATNNTCPKCWTRMSVYKVSALDDTLVTLHDNLKVSCLYHDKGCLQTVVLCGLEKHEKECGFRPREECSSRPDSKKQTEEGSSWPTEKCSSRPKEKCSSRPKGKCSSRPKEKCSSRADSEKHTEECSSRPTEKCSSRPTEKCSSRPTERCSSRSDSEKHTEDLECSSRPKEKCSSRPKEKCSSRPKEKCSSRPKEKCSSRSDSEKHIEECSFRRDTEEHVEESGARKRHRGRGKAKQPLLECSSQYGKRNRLPDVISSVNRFCSDHFEDKKDVLFFMLLNHLRETNDQRQSMLYRLWSIGDVDVGNDFSELKAASKDQFCGICREPGHNKKTCTQT